ncbi:TniQ family protein [uncultured Serinicoccus sp.]|uniref:TniQ family protein n=1 Tax=uncultured Serinicoccus sp. TaxID=735514 RepID=UPI00262D4FFA|nr:TniQ family protein [uncultured Serinicoccus sp.]
MTAAPALPISISPRDGESIESWLEHLADANGLTTAQLLTHLRSRGASTRYLTLAPAPGTIRALAELGRTTPDTVRDATLARFDGTALDLTGLDALDRHSYRQVASRGWTPAHGTQICPPCLAQTGTWQSAWRLMIVTACTRHGTLLAAACPSCRRPFRDQRHSHLRPVGAGTICGNPLGAGPTSQCQHDLAAIPTTTVDDPLLVTQARIDNALSDRPVTVLGEPAGGAAYLGDLRHLTTLLLHLACRPGAEQLAGWASDLLPESQRRTGDRGPRWGMRPPAPPALRAAALTMADRILAAANLDTAATALTPWTELTPAANDGPLGWLADRTVMTPTLSRLVLSARAPHRRLSHHLDSHPHRGARMPINLVAIPQVIPHQQYAEHLVGAFDSREEVVRQFASLCLARLHPDITSWAAAAQALGMPGSMGTRCARACSATRLTTTQEWQDRIRAAITDVRPRNYRATEAKIEHRLHLTNRWFHEWTRLHRPGTHYTSVSYALTWQWVHVAHAHLDLSPTWQGTRPTAKERALYRQFENSLNDKQQFELAYALHKRA